MSAETLRRAAALMRERAEAAESTSPWRAGDASEWVTTTPTWEVTFSAPLDDPLVPGEEVAVANYVDEGDAAHIASWHPAVALAVADWLVSVADDGNADFDLINSEGWSAVTVARVYLGEAA